MISIRLNKRNRQYTQTKYKILLLKKKSKTTQKTITRLKHKNICLMPEYLTNPEAALYNYINHQI